MFLGTPKRAPFERLSCHTGTQQDRLQHHNNKTAKENAEEDYKMHKIVIEPKNACFFTFRCGKPRKERKTYIKALQNPSETQVNQAP